MYDGTVKYSPLRKEVAEVVLGKQEVKLLAQMVKV